MRKPLIIIIILILMAIAVTVFVPPYIDKKTNTVLYKEPIQISDAARQLYDSLPFIADFHSDALLWDRNLLKKNDAGAVDIPRMQQSNMALQAFTIVTKTPYGLNFNSNSADAFDMTTALYILQARPLSSWFDLSERVLVQCRALHKAAEKSEGKFRVISSKKELESFIRDRQQDASLSAGFLGIEGLHCLENKLENIDEFYKAGVRMMAPVHFFDNEVGGSAHGVKKGGLTPFGKDVIRKCESKNIIIDVAHCSPALLDDILAVATRPLVSSHGGIYGTHPSVRNLTDQQLKAIAATGGLIGIGCWEAALGGKDIHATAKAMIYTARLVGVEHVCLGTDNDGAIASYVGITGLPLLVEALIKQGMSPADIALVMGGNMRRFLLENFPEGE